MVKITQVSTIESAENKNNYMDGSGSSRLVKLVTGLCIGQIVIGITATTILGVIVERHAKDIDGLKHNTGTLQDDVKLLQANTVHGKALGSKDTANIKSKLFNPESNETNIYSEHIKIKHQVEEVNAKIDMIEVDKNTNIAAIQQNADILTIALTELEEHKSILQNISTTLDVLTSNSYTQLNNDNNPYNGTLSHIEASIDREIKINKEQTTMITLLESNLTYEAEARYFQYDTIQALNATTMLLEANTRDLNVTVHINSNKLADLESDMAHDRLRLDNIATQVQLVATLANYSDHIYNLETSQVALNFNIQVLHNAVQKLELNANFTQQILEDTSSSIQLLELQANSTQQALIDHGTRMHAIELELGYLEDYNKRIQQVETETNFTKDTLEDIKTTIQDIEHVGNLTKNSVHDIIGRLANMTGKAMSAFSVGLESDPVVPFGDKVIYDHVIFDLNGDYNMSTGEFVAPIAGLYEFTFHATGWWNEELWLELYCNDRYFIAAYGEMINATYPVTGNAAVFELKNKDRCYIKSGKLENKLWGGPGEICTTFSGHLIAPDAR